jgi:DNA (cytosine-5)-methyltransferase 1
MLQFIRIVTELRPKTFVLENVQGLAVGKQKKFLEEILSEFTSIGYQICQPYQVLNAINYGVPQDRRRIIILGSREDVSLPRYPTPTTEPNITERPTPFPSWEGLGVGEFPSWEGLGVGTGLFPTPRVIEAIGDLPEIEEFDELFETDSVVAKYGPASGYAAYLRGLRQLKDDFSYPRHFNKNLLTSSMRTKHSDTSVERFKKTIPGKVEKVSRFLRLDPDGFCNTLRAGTASDRGAHTSPRPIHPFKPRCITVREAARLHSYPDWFRFHKTKWHGFRQIGNSVPPFLAKAISSELIKILSAKPVKPSKIYVWGAEELLGWSPTEAAQYFIANQDT